VTRIAVTVVYAFCVVPTVAHSTVLFCRLHLRYVAFTFTYRFTFTIRYVVTLFCCCYLLLLRCCLPDTSVCLLLLLCVVVLDSFPVLYFTSTRLMHLYDIVLLFVVLFPLYLTFTFGSAFCFVDLLLTRFYCLLIVYCRYVRLLFIDYCVCVYILLITHWLLVC